MSKWDEQILVVNRKELFNNEENHFYGFIEKDICLYRFAIGAPPTFGDSATNGFFVVLR